MPQQIVLATHNPHKVAEFGRIVAATRPDLHVIGYDGPEPVEDGVNFAHVCVENPSHTPSLEGPTTLAVLSLTGKNSIVVRPDEIQES